jgi:hypothetical protein
MDCTYCGRRQRSRNSQSWIVLTTTSTTCLQNVASCCTTCNFIKLNLDMLTFLRRCHHIHHLNIGADGREDYRQEWPPIPGRLSRSRRLSAGQAPRNTRGQGTVQG